MEANDQELAIRKGIEKAYSILNLNPNKEYTTKEVMKAFAVPYSDAVNSGSKYRQIELKNAADLVRKHQNPVQEVETVVDKSNMPTYRYKVSYNDESVVIEGRDFAELKE